MEILVIAVIAAVAIWWFFLRDPLDTNTKETIVAPYKVPEPAATTPIPLVVEPVVAPVEQQPTPAPAVAPTPAPAVKAKPAAAKKTAGTKPAAKKVAPATKTVAKSAAPKTTKTRVKKAQSK